MIVNSTRPRRRRKRTDRPDKPYPEFPLQPHGAGHWSKRIRGQLCYFGRWAKRESGELITLPDGGNWKAALARYKAEIDDLQAGRSPRARAGDSDRAKLADLCNRFLTSKKRQLDARELSPRTFREYGEACDLMIDHFGKQRLVGDVLPVD